MIEVKNISKEDWSLLSENAHKIAFDEHKPASWDRIDYALMAEEDGVPLGYVTCREIDEKTVYWQFGGAFPGTRRSARAFFAYAKFIEWSHDRYQRINTFIENTNIPMLKMAMSVGFRIVGIRTYQGSVLLEHCLEFSHAR